MYLVKIISDKGLIQFLKALPLNARKIESRIVFTSFLLKRTFLMKKISMNFFPFVKQTRNVAKSSFTIMTGALR